ncbi:pentapeptide repeat-containing protein [Pseudanabaena sp. FACHB-1998]|uniref:nSTAND1 domain-containing NTPase n=1 Tax=Pseudanabaena sp. FACHB-1998 TaxID=2692858 RepID=UPI0016805534|nr:pentapeptide repeat-containing protein [Pseudanabaena sp. FACHB-1998]MBD2178424.1 pentapeptide repeat-containing protein [Pseudanabaena sp. FACHB-1998]
MTNSSDSEYQRKNLPSTEIEQKVMENQGQAIGQMTGGLAVGHVGHLTVYVSNSPNDLAPPKSVTSSSLGANPYQGLKAFREHDWHRFFGRNDDIKRLYLKFRELHDRPNAVRVLPIYGPSGSGKSSLARAGLIRALGKYSLPGKDRGRVVSLTPGARPLEALATVLARIATNDNSPAEKVEEFERVLKRQNDHQKFDGLRRIANVFPDINFSPLIILVDQFEEIYTYQKGNSGDFERQAFIGNLLCAASDLPQNVSVILTLRSDFLGKTQQDPELNKLFASQGVLVPIMQPSQLAIAITEPAKRAGYEIDKATVNLLIKDSQGQEGTLPLLQFALTQIWEGLLQEPQVTPAETLEKIGGVGGALANEAKRLYESLTSEQQQIARSAFLSMVQLNDDNKATRRRATISELVKDASKKHLVREVIDCFAKPGVWILVTSSSKEEVEMVEIAHEALINNWEELRAWLDKNSLLKLQRDEIHKAAVKWKSIERSKSKDYLLQGRVLRDALEFQKSLKDNPDIFLSNTAKEFLQASIQKQRNNIFKAIGIFLIFPAIITIAAIPSILRLIENVQVDRAKKIAFADDCDPSPNTREALEYLIKKGYKLELAGIRLCNENIPNIDLSGSDLSGSDLRNANLGGANLKKTFLINAKLQGAKLMESDLSGAFLRKAQMQESQLQLTVLKGANLPSANLQKARLEEADLSGADLSDADLSGATLSNTDLSGSNLSGTKFSNAILINTVIIDSKGISIQQLNKARKICGTKLSSQFLVKYSKEVAALRKIQVKCDSKK